MPITKEFIEPEIFPLVQALNGMGGVRTFASCQGHWHLEHGMASRPYVAFEANVCQIVALRKKLFKSLFTHYPWQLRSFERPHLGLGYVLEIPVEWWRQKNAFWWQYFPLTSALSLKKWTTHQAWVLEDVKDLTHAILQMNKSTEEVHQETPWMVQDLKDPSLRIKIWTPSEPDLCWRALCDMLNIDPLTLQIESIWDPQETCRTIAFRGLPEDTQELVLTWLKANFKDNLIELS